MGAAPPSKPSTIPSRPFDREPHRRRSCLAHTMLPPPTKRNRSTTLIQLVLVQDWQRVLIRCTLFPHEISQTSIVNIRGIDWKVLPLHLACAFQPPTKVIAMLLQYHSEATSVPLERVRRRQRKFFKRVLQNVTNLTTDDAKELLTTRGDYFDDASISTSATKTKVRMTNVMYYPPGSLVSREESIGDVDGISSCGDTTTANTLDHVMYETSLCDFLDQTGIVLQLSPSGGILPMPLQSKETASSTTPDDEDESIKIELEYPSLLEAAEANTVLPIHIACLYKASPSVLHLLLQEHSMGALSAIMGMLPIHLVAAGWHLEPLASHIPNQVFEEPDKVQVLQVLVNALPESLLAKSGNHAMTPMKYVEDIMMEGYRKEKCLEYLGRAQLDCQEGTAGSPTFGEIYTSSSSSSASNCIPTEIRCPTSSLSDSTMSTKSQSVLYNLLLERNWTEALDLLQQDPTQAREWHYGIDENSGTTTELVLWKRLALHLACAVAAPIGLVELLLNIYPQAIDKSDPHNGSTPLHLSCQFGASVQVVRALLQARTALTKAVDVRGRNALHYAVLAAAPYPTIELLVQHDPASALCPDQDGKTPLQYAHYVYPSGSHIMGFLETVWI